MFALLHSLAMFVIDFFKSPRRLEAENLFLRHRLSIALRRAPPRLRLRGSDRALMVWMTRIWPSLLGAAQVVQPETILRWHRAGFTAFWRWKSRKRAGRPQIVIHVFCIMRRMEKCATQRLARQQGAGFRSLKDGQHIEQVACRKKGNV